MEIKNGTGPDQLIRLSQVINLVGLKRSWIYQRTKEGKFPRPIKIGSRASVWTQISVAAWIQKMAEAKN
jgi:prophage regulatory protein